MKMQIRYYTQKGSVYIYRSGESGGWLKQDRNGIFLPLAGAIHLPRTRLQDLIRDYPTSALDTTVCFGSGLAKEFFDDAKREHVAEIPEGKETNIFFLVSRGNDQYSLGYSSTVVKIEKTESIDTDIKNPHRPAM